MNKIKILRLSSFNSLKIIFVGDLRRFKVNPNEKLFFSQYASLRTGKLSVNKND
jgi:hypothetical protein